VAVGKQFFRAISHPHFPPFKAVVDQFDLSSRIVAARRFVRSVCPRARCRFRSEAPTFQFHVPALQLCEERGANPFPPSKKRVEINDSSGPVLSVHPGLRGFFLPRLLVAEFLSLHDPSVLFCVDICASLAQCARQRRRFDRAAGKAHRTPGIRTLGPANTQPNHPSQIE